MAKGEDLPKNSEEIEIKVEPESEEKLVYLTEDEESSKESSKESKELGEKVDKLMNKLKLIALEVDKKSADLEIKIGKLEERFKDVFYDFPKLKERTDTIEDQLHVANLGLMDLKKKLDDVDSRVSGLEKIPATVEGRIVGLENKVKKIDDYIQKIYLRLDEVEKIKKDVTRDLEGLLETKESSLKNEISVNKAEIEHLKKSIDAISLSIKSFGRTLELTNIDDIIKRFDSLDKRIMNLENAVLKLRNIARESAIKEGDVEVFKQKLKEISTTVLNALNRINKFETTMKDKLGKIEALSKSVEQIETIKSAAEDVRKQIKIMREIQASVQDLYGKIMRIYDSGKIGWDRVQNVARDLSELDKLKADLEDLRRIVEWLVNEYEANVT